MTAPAPRNHPAEDAQPAPTPAPVAVPECGAQHVDVLGQGEAEVIWTCDAHDHDSDTHRTALGIDGQFAKMWRTPSPEPVVACAGHATCNAPVHEHGCYNDHGSCESPEEHRPEPVVAPHEFDEDVADASMCMCGVPALGHEIVEPVAAPPLSEAVDALAEVIWTASRADESTISAIGAQHVARAVVAAGYRLVPEDDEDAKVFPDDYGWGDLMRLLDEHWPADLFGGIQHPVESLTGDRATDTGLRAVALLRWVDHLRAEDDEDTVRVPRVALIELNAAVMDRKRDLVDAIEEFNDEVRS